MAKYVERGAFVLLLACILYAASLIDSTYKFFSGDSKDMLSEDIWRIVAVIPNDANVDVERIREETEASGERYGALVEFYETSTEEEQERVIQIAADSGADGILLYPITETGYTTPLAVCRQRGIPVVVICQRLENADFDTFIGSAIDSERMAVRSCVTATGGKGSILVIDRLQRGEETYMEAILLSPDQKETAVQQKKLRTRVSDLAETPFVGYYVQDSISLDEEQAASANLYSELWELLRMYDPQAVFSYDENVTNAIAACLANRQNTPKIYAVGYGRVQECADLLRAGILDGIVQQNDSYSAALAVRYLVQLCKGSIMPNNVDSGITLISRDNLERILAGNEM